MTQQNNNLPLSISPSAARAILWRKGMITDFLLDSNQKILRDQIRASLVKGKRRKKTHVGVFARQMGKSYGVLSFCSEECLNRTNITVAYVTPNMKQGKKIVKMNFDEILKDCPQELKPKFNRETSSWVFPSTGSKIELYGFNADEIESARGPKAHIVVVDECGFMTNFKYGLRSVLYPKLNSTKGPMILISTLPKSQGHEFWEIVKKAEFDGTLLKKNIYDCPRYDADDIAGFADEVGGFESVDFKREYLNIMISDEDSAVIPEADDELMDLIVREYKRPPYFDPYASMDIGGKDFTAVLYGYLDFLTGKLIIEDEATFRGKKFTTNTLAASIKETEEKHWGLKKPYLRVADNNNIILLNDLGIDHGIHFMPTAKDNKMAWINQIRIMLADERIIINPRCKQLIFHLKNATWNKSKTDYERSLDGGHYDLVDALAYLIRNVAFTRNPYPKGYGMTFSDSHLRLENSNNTKFEQHLINMFSMKKH